MRTSQRPSLQAFTFEPSAADGSGASDDVVGGATDDVAGMVAGLAKTDADAAVAVGGEFVSLGPEDVEPELQPTADAHRRIVPNALRASACRMFTAKMIRTAEP
jgi:hypothetical protein